MSLNRALNQALENIQQISQEVKDYIKQNPCDEKDFPEILLRILRLYWTHEELWKDQNVNQLHDVLRSVGEKIFSDQKKAHDYVLKIDAGLREIAELFSSQNMRRMQK